MTRTELTAQARGYASVFASSRLATAGLSVAEAQRPKPSIESAHTGNLDTCWL